MALVANTAPVAFGAIAIPIVTLAGLTEIPKEDLGAMVGRQTPLLALFVPLILVGMVDGWRGVRAVWPAALVGGVSFAIGQFVCSNYISVELTDIVASLLSVAAMVAFLRVWQPGDPLIAERAAAAARRSPAPRRTTRRTRRRCAAARATGTDSRARRDRRLRALRDHHHRLRPRAARARSRTSSPRARGSSRGPGVDIVNAKGEAPTAVTYKLNWAAGGGLAAAGLRPADDGLPADLAPAPRCSAYVRHDQAAQVGDADRRRGARRSRT